MNIITDKKIEYEAEKAHYRCLTTEQSGLKLDMLLDADGAYQKFGHPLVAFVRNAHDHESEEFFITTISGRPQIVNGEIKPKVDIDDHIMCCLWIMKHEKHLRQLADGEITFEAILRLVDDERRNPLYDDELYLPGEYWYYTTITPSSTGLPVDVLIDESMGYIWKKHKVITYVRNSYDHFVNDYTAVTVEKQPKVVSENKVNIYPEDLALVLDWIRKFEVELKTVANCKLSAWDLCKKSQRMAFHISPHPLPSRMEYMLRGSYEIISTRDGKKLNITHASTGALLSSVWFDYIDNNIFSEDGCDYVMGYANRKLYKVLLPGEGWICFGRNYIVQNEDGKCNVRNGDGKLLSKRWLSYIVKSIRTNKRGRKYLVGFDEETEKTYRIYLE